MFKKTQQASSADKPAAPPLTDAVKDSAQQIWLAGLGAFAKAQEEGGKVFEALAKEGLAIQRKTQASAEDKLSEATSKMTSMASDIQSKAGQQWGKLESIFEERVAKALNKLGVPSAKDVEALASRIDALNKSVQQMNGKAPAAKAAARSSAEAAAKPAAKKTARPAAKRPAAGKSV